MLNIFQQGQFGRRRVGGAAAAATDPNFANVRALIHFDGSDGSTSFPDTSPIATRPSWTAQGNAQIDTAQSKFGGASGLFDGNGDYLSADASLVALGNADLTIEAWVRLNATGRHTIVSRYAGAGGYLLDIGPATEARLLLRNSAGGFSTAAGATTLSTGVWYHIAGTISGTSMRVFVDGTIDGTATFSGTRSEGSGGAVRVGWDSPGTAGRYMNGWIDDLRCTAGVARYTANFTPPSAAFPDS